MESSDRPAPYVVKESIAAAILTSHQLIVGHLHAHPQKRLKDEMNRISDRYIAVTQARVYDTAGASLLYEASFLLVSNESVVTVTPLSAITGPVQGIWQLPDH
jgi:uncharacterized protein DUF6812